MVTLNEVLLMLTALSCSVISITLGTFQRKGARHNRLMGFFSLILIISSGSIVILILTGQYTSVNPPEAVLIMAFAVVVVLAGGNVGRIFRYQNPHKAE